MKILTSSDTHRPEDFITSRNTLIFNNLPFEAFVERALYDPQIGYYAQRSVGEDFVTSPRLSPAFGYALSRLVTEFGGHVGDGLFGIVDIGCGDGALLQSVISELPQPVRDRASFWGIDRAAPLRADGLIHFARELESLPAGLPLLILCNELFDALPFARLVQRNHGLREMYVVSNGDALDWDERPARPLYIEYLEQRGIRLQEGQFADISLGWSELYARVCAHPGVRLVVTFDYGFPQPQLFDARVRNFGTAAAYWRHQVSRDLLARPGEQDLTAHINFTDLISAGESLGFDTLRFARQAEFLLALGITQHRLFIPAAEVETGSLAEAVEQIDQREAARRLVLPDGVGEEIRVLVQGRGVPKAGWSFQQKLF